MTLAIGMRCQQGILLAADTLFSYADGSIQHEAKVFECASTSGRYAIVHSSEDAHAAESLINELRQKLDKANPGSSDVFESAIKSVLQRWYIPVHDNRPRMQLLCAANIKAEPPKLYFCEPPNAVIPLQENYKAIGDGWSISDRLYKWFEAKEPKQLHECLCQISYIMHKTKEWMPSSVGGDTDICLISGQETLWIDRLSMKVAESRGIAVDRDIGKMASLIMAGNAEETQVLDIAAGIFQTGLNYSRLEFTCRDSGTIIRHNRFCT